jgi:hypothetical protein
MMTSTIRIVAAVALIVGAGLAHGKWAGRFGTPPELAALARRVDAIPLVIGDWKAEVLEIPAMERALAGAVACLSRRYTNSSRGVSVSVLLVGGLPGKISTHTPEACYQGAGGYSLEAPTPFVYSYGAEGHRAGFRTTLAKRGGTDPSVLRLYWGWNASAGWSAPDEPRWAFGSASALCKLYVVRETSGAVVEPERDPCTEFMGVFLPELDRRVFSVPPRADGPR